MHSLGKYVLQTALGVLTLLIYLNCILNTYQLFFKLLKNVNMSNVHCSTVYNSKDLESTQMPINDRLDKENVAHIHQGILGSHSRQTNTRTETKHRMFSLISGC